MSDNGGSPSISFWVCWIGTKHKPSVKHSEFTMRYGRHNYTGVLTAVTVMVGRLFDILLMIVMGIFILFIMMVFVSESSLTEGKHSIDILLLTVVWTARMAGIFLERIHQACPMGVCCRRIRIVHYKHTNILNHINAKFHLPSSGFEKPHHSPHCSKCTVLRDKY